MLFCSFKFTLVYGAEVWIYVEASDVSTMCLEDPRFYVYDKDGFPMELMYDRETFEQVEDTAHRLIYESEVDNDEEKRLNEAIKGTQDNQFGTSDV